MIGLRRVWFSSVGHRDARLAPLELDFTGDGGEVVDSVLWLRNGGGKSSILNLFFALLRPDRREFLGSEAEGRQRRLEDYVDGDDTAHVVAEWDVPEPGSLPGLDSGRVVTGMVMEWRDRTRSADASRLRRAWYSFRPREQSLTLDSLPTARGDTVPGIGRFLDLLRESAREDPLLELTISDTQGEWQRRLTDLGLDPELYRYQLGMNRREGSAHEVFRFRDAAEFVNFLLGLVVDPTEPDQVAANLGAFSGELARRPALETERRFISGALEHLGPLAESVRRRDEAVARFAAAGVSARTLAGSLSARAAVALAEAEAHRSAADASESERTLYARRNLVLNNQAGEARRLAADFRLAEAQQRLGEAESAERDANDAASAWATAEVVAERASLVATIGALEIELAREEASLAPLRAERDEAAGRLAARLERLRDEARGEARKADDDVAAASGSAVAAGARREEALAARAGAEARLTEIVRRRDESERERRELESDGVLRGGEAASVGAARLARRDAELVATLERCEARLSSLAVDRSALAAETAASTGRLAETTEQLRAGEERLGRLRGDADALLAGGRLGELAECDADDVDLWGSGPMLLDRLARLVDAADNELVEVEVSGLDDRRALAALRDTGLLPPSRDVERVMGALLDGGVPAATGWSHLAVSIAVDNRDGALKRRPDLAGGVVVPAAEHLDSVQRVLGAAKPVVDVAVTVGSAEGFAATEVGGVDDRLVVSPRRALFDPAEATSETDAREAAVAAVDGRRGALRERRETDTALASGLRRFLSDYPDGVADRWVAEVDRLTADRESLERRVAELEARAAAVEVEVVEVAGQIGTAREERHALAGWMARAAAAARRAEEVAGLVDEARALSARLDELAAAAEIATGEVARAIAERDAAERARATAEARAERLSAERALLDVEAGTDGPDAELGVDALRASYASLDERWRGLVSSSVLADRRARAGAKLSQVDSTLADPVHALSRGAAEALLAQSTDTDTQARAVARRQADADARGAAAHRAGAAAAVAQAEQAVAGAAQADGRRTELPTDLRPATAGAADALAARLALEGSEAAEKASAAEKAAATAQRAAVESERENERFDGLAARLHAALDTAAADEDDNQEREPFAGSHDDAVGAEQQVRAELGDAAAVEDTAAREVASQVEAVRSFALADAFEQVKGKVRERLVQDPADVLAARAGDHAEALEIRLAQLDQQLASLQEHQELLVRSLAGLVDTALGHLRRAESSSRLPESLDAWAGKPFVRIRFDAPERDEEQFARLDAVVDAVVGEGSVPEGLPLLLRATHAVVGKKGFDVTILKPDALLRPDRHPVAEMSRFSDGQQLTAAILLYCTLARLRARNRGRSHAGGGVLLLDNPIGTCSNVSLLDLQRRVAAAMGVQLLYTTGVNDLDALATLPNCIRLRNDKVDRRSGRFHIVADGDRDGDVEPGSPGAIRAARVYRREAVPARNGR